MKRLTTILFMTLLASCGANNNNAITTDVNDLNISNNTTQTPQPVNGQSISLCGNIYSFSSDFFNISFQFNATNGVRYDVVAGDQRTQSLLNQMPPNVTANNVCARAFISGTRATLTNISQQ